MARAEATRKSRTRQKTQDLSLFYVAGGALLFCITLIFFLSKSPSEEYRRDYESVPSNSQKKEDRKEDPPALLQKQLKQLKNFQERFQLDILPLPLTEASILPLSAFDRAVQEKAGSYEKTSESFAFYEFQEHLKQKWEALGDALYHEREKEGVALLQQGKIEEARQVWKKYPSELQGKTKWYLLAQEIQKPESPLKQEKFERDVSVIHTALEKKELEKALLAVEKVKLYASPEQVQELQPLLSLLREALLAQKLPEAGSGSSSSLALNPKKEETLPPVEEENTPEQSPTFGTKKDPFEKEAEALFTTASLLLEKQDFVQARDQFRTLLDQYEPSQFVHSSRRAIRELYHQALISASPENEKVVARLESALQGKVKVISKRKDKEVFSVYYTFKHPEELEDFEFKREDGPINHWKLKEGGLFGTSSHALYWTPPLVGDLIVELRVKAKTLKNLGICIHSTGYHRRYVFYPSLDDGWAPWAKGDTAILSSRETRYDSVKLAFADLGFSQISLKDDEEFFIKIQRKEKKLLFWGSTQEISSKMKPLLSAEDEELEQGQIVLLGAQGTTFTSLQMTGSFDPGWFRKFR